MSLLYPFLINDKLYIKLNEDINSFDPRTTELEFRIGYIDEKSSFVPGIYESQYNNILNTLNEYYKDKKEDVKYFDSKVYYYEEKYRKIIVGNEIEYQEKSKVHNYDFNLFFFVLRYSQSEEKNITDPELIKKIDSLLPTLTRFRERRTFKFPKGTNEIKIELTKVDEKSQTRYEFEIEITKKMTVDNLSSYLTQLFNILFPRAIHFPQYNLYSLIQQEKTELWPLKLGHIKDIITKPYYLSNKLDGIRMFVYFHKLDVSLVNPSVNYSEQFDNAVTEGGYLIDDSYNDTLLDSEVIIKNNNYYVYPFDVMKIKGKDITQSPFSERKKHIVKLLKYVNNRGTRITFISKKFYESTYTGLLLCLNDIKIDENDGVVFIPDIQYSNKLSYKYKFPWTITIDFRLKKISSNTFALQHYTSKNPVRYEDFKGSKEHPLNDVATLKSNVANEGDIVEVRYLNGEFEITRNRPDKIFPNHKNI